MRASSLPFPYMGRFNIFKYPISYCVNGHEKRNSKC